MKKIFVSLMALTLASMPLCDCSAIEAEDQSDVTTSQTHPVESANGKGKQVGVGYANKHGKKIAAATAATTATAAAGIAAYKLKDYYQAAAAETMSAAGTSDSEFVDAGNNTSSNLTNSTVNFVSENATSDVDADTDDLTNDDLDTERDENSPKQGNSSEAKPTFWDQINTHVWSPLYDYVLRPTGTFARDYVWSPMIERIDTEPAEAGVAGALIGTGVTGLLTTYEPDPFEAIVTEDILRSSDEDDKLADLGSKLRDVTNTLDKLANGLPQSVLGQDNKLTVNPAVNTLEQVQDQITDKVVAGLNDMIGGAVIGAGTKVAASNTVHWRARLHYALYLLTGIYGGLLMWVL